MSDYKADAKASRGDKMRSMGCYESGGSVKPKPITADVQNFLEQRIRNAGSDEELSRINRVARERYGIGR